MPAAITLSSRQRRMMDFWNLGGYYYACIGRTTPWESYKSVNTETGLERLVTEDDADFNPPYPTGYETYVTEAFAWKRITKMYFAKIIPNPTTAQKEDIKTIYYKGLYYKVTTDTDVALSEGYVSILLWCRLNRDDIPLNTYRQVGLYTQVKINPDKFGNNIDVLLPNKWELLSDSDKGKLEVVDNRKPQSRSLDQQEELYFMIDF